MTSNSRREFIAAGAAAAVPMRATVAGGTTPAPGGAGGLAGKVAVVYGAAGSMGSAVARAFAREGAHVELAGRTLEKVQALATEIAEFEQAVGDQDAGLSAQVGGTAGLVALVNRGVELRMQLLPLVRNKFQADPSIAAEWETASRIVRVKRNADEETEAEAAEVR